MELASQPLASTIGDHRKVEQGSRGRFVRKDLGKDYSEVTEVISDGEPVLGVEQLPRCENQFVKVIENGFVGGRVVGSPSLASTMRRLRASSPRSSKDVTSHPVGLGAESVRFCRTTILEAVMR